MKITMKISRENPAQLRIRRRWIFGMSLPIIVQNLVNHMQVLIDRAFLGNVDSRFLTAIGNVIVPYNAVIVFLVFAGTGITVLVAQHLGAGRTDDAREVSESSLVFATLFSTSLWVMWLVGADGIFGLLGAGGQVRKDAVEYVGIVSASLIFFGAETAASSTLQGIGTTRPIMFTGILKNLLNLLLDWVLIFGHLGFPEMGLAGAAWATMISNSVGSIVLVFAALLHPKLPFRYRIRDVLRPQWRRFRRAFSMGVPSGVESLLWFVGQLVILRMMNAVDPGGIGVLSLLQSIQLIGLAIYSGFSRTATTVVGQNWGRGDRDEAVRAGFHCLRLAGMVSVSWGLLMVIFRQPFTRLFTSDPEVLTVAQSLMVLPALFIVFQTLNIVVGRSIRGTGDTRWMLNSQIFGTIFVLLASWLLVVVAGLGLTGMYLTMVLDEAVRGGINTARFVLDRNPFRRGGASMRQRIAQIYGGKD